MPQSLRRLSNVLATFVSKNADDKALGLVALAAVIFVVVVPFTAAKYPPLVDVPFHAAQIAILAHYNDPAWHFHEQFSLHPLEVPYLSMYGIGAAAALVFPIEVAVKIAAVSMLALLPAGLAVLFYGMRKSPLLGVAGLGLVWCTVTYWGFLNFLGALGLYAASIGFALMCVDRPTRGAQVGLALTLVAIFLTHIYRVPFALATVVLVALVAYPVTKRWKPLVWPVIPALCLFVVWQFVREKDLVAPLELGLHFERIREMPKHLFGAYLPPEPIPMTPLAVSERHASLWLLGAVVVTTGANIALGRMDRRERTADEGRESEMEVSRVRERTPPDRRWRRVTTIVPLSVSAGLLVLYFTLPMELGRWFYVFPREIVAAAFIGLGAMPDLPRRPAYRLAIVAALALAAAQLSGLATRQFRRFDALANDFDAVVERIGPAPKLLYLMYDLGGTERRASPFLHLPAWVQAQRGGWLGFHFVAWNHSPIRYRSGSPDVPPPLPRRFEWEPQHFRYAEHGTWFDTILVRHRIDPTALLFGNAPNVELVTRQGNWWLYEKRTTR